MISFVSSNLVGPPHRPSIMNIGGGGGNGGQASIVMHQGLPSGNNQFGGGGRPVLLSRP